MQHRNNMDKLQEIARCLGGALKKIGHSRYPGGRLVALEGRSGRRAIANYKTVFNRGKPVGSNIAGWVAL